ncbi:GIY-YIG nuclease family protein, partial [Thiolapillus sp.]|uniref:GIY-YIG nuclease family protein n=1 Tax=Thiolapillus sp. TaxID=2017437 RepID=UPI003AF8AA46
MGETGRTLDTRFKEHLADIKHHRDKPVANHFNQAGHSIHNIRVKGLWLLFTDNASDRKDMESHLIDKLGSRRPGGINEKLSLFFCVCLFVFASLCSPFFFFLLFVYFTLE